jgi:SAM-dependent methyltransferase
MWEQLQANGEVSYEEEPESNLGVGERADCLAFSRFCRFDGLVLDVGCGPQAWPAYYAVHTPETRFVGVDPLAGDRAADYVQVRALAEYLPFGDGRFDQVVFATTLDHFVDPERALTEGIRVLRPGDAVSVWIGEKQPDTPPPAESSDWYEGLVKPEGAEDVFHVKRLDLSEVESLLSAVGLEVLERESHRIDDFRANHFFRLAARGGP